MISFFASLTLLAAAVDEGDVSATPRYRAAPAFPAACAPPPGAAMGPQRVIIVYSVTRDGEVVNARVRESTNECFNDVAIGAARGWSFDPARKDGRAVQQDDLETTLVFQMEETTTAQDFDARPIKRLPPRYPEKCMRIAKSTETVIVEFDVTAEGLTSNARVAESTEPCLNESARDSVRDWKFRPKVEGGKAVERKGVQTAIIYELSNSGIDYPFRRSFTKRMNAVRSKLKRKADPAEILNDLNAIEGEFGDDFTDAERGAFYQFRGALKLQIKDYRGALDDLRIAQKGQLSLEAGEATAKVVEQLETYVAAEDAVATRQADEAGAAESTEAEQPVAPKE